MGDRPSAPRYRSFPEGLWTALGILSLQTPATAAFARSLPAESLRRLLARGWLATVRTATPGMGDRPSTPSYPPLTEWRWTALAIFSLQTPATSAFAKSLPTESS